MTHTLISFGHGYTARVLAHRLRRQGWRILGTTRKADGARDLKAAGVEPLLFGSDETRQAIGISSHILVSVGPDAEGDPVLRHYRDEIAARAPALDWVGYLSTTGVYGDRHGDWVDENTPCAPSTRRGEMRVAAEEAWQSVPGLPLHIFRLAGIYGPGRGPFAKLRNGTARRIVKPGQVFSRIHVEDIASVLEASIAHPDPGAIYNVCDDDPAPPQDVIAHAAKLLGVPVPPAVPFEDADLSPMARSFYAESKRVRNGRIKDELGVRLSYPSYREGLSALLAGGD